MRRGSQYKFFPHQITATLLILLTAFTSYTAVAESRTPHRTELALTGLAGHLAQTSAFSAASDATASSDRQNIKPVTVRAQIYGEGRIEASLTIKRNFSGERSFTVAGREVPDTTNATFLQGKLAIGGSVRRSSSTRIVPTALSVINNKLRVTFLGRRKGSKGRQRLYTIIATVGEAAPTTARVSSIPARATRKGACSTPVEDVAGHRHDTHEIESHPESELQAQTLVTARVATLSTDADPEWYAKFGNESNAEILRVINTSEALFFRNFGIAFRIVKQHTYTDASPYTSTRADYLLSQFVRNPENPSNLGLTAQSFDTDVDLKHLFSGKTIENNVLGIAYIGSLCATPHLAYGLTQAHIFDATFGIFSHEISHSLGAFHDASAPGTVMYPSISIPPANLYSTRSLSEIRGFLQRSNSCLSVELVDRHFGDDSGSIENQDPEPRALTLKKQSLRRGTSIRLSGTLSEGASSPVVGTVINLIVKNTVVATTTTNALGRYSFTLSSRTIVKRGASAYTATEDWGTISKALAVSVARSRR